VPAAAAAGFRRDGWWLGLTLTDLLRRRARATPAAPAVIAGARTLSFGDLDRESEQIAAGLATLGVGPGDVVSCQLPDGPEVVLLQHAVARRRAIFNPIHLSYRAAEVGPILAFAGSRVMVVGPPSRGVDPAATVAALRPRLPALAAVVTIGPPREGAIAWEDVRRAGPAGPPERPRPEDPFLLLFTSGTTASPKATLHTHDLRLGNARLNAREWGLTPADRVLLLARQSHMWGLMVSWMALDAGAPLVLLEAASPGAVVEAVRRAGATVAVGAPPHVADLLGAPDLDARALATLRLFALSGSVCPPALVRRLRATLGCVPLVLWGMTETGGGCFTRPDDPPAAIEETIGRAAPGCALAILDEAGAALPTGAEGELAIRSPFVFEGYVDNAEATAEAFTADGWFRTGDLATLDAEGRVRIHGRRTEQVNRGGVKFHPADVEDVLARHPAVRQAALVGLPDARLGERACCVVVLAPGAPPPALADLTALLDAAGVAKFKWPERLEIVEALPLTPTGKVQRAVLRARVAAAVTDGS
jgi:acyl-CoA synthetase (AMP-forming)/AMP-acid ligase II